MFYIRPPKGLAVLYTLEETVLTRLQYLEALYKNKTNEFQGKIEYLLEGSIYDEIGHFVLRLLSGTSPDFFSYWLERETLFFKYRLQNLSSKQLNRLLRTVIKHVTEQQYNNAIDNTLLQISTRYLQNHIFYHIINKGHDAYCKLFCMEVDFELVPNLVKLKAVDLCNGQAIIYCSQWQELLVSLFHTFITHRVYGSNALCEITTVLKDSRLIFLNQRIQYGLLVKGLNCGQITSQNIDSEVLKFPLCMRHLHIVLRDKHRLSHYARFYYTLFLKDCGMKMEDAIEYWKAEYLKPHVCGSGCNHNWQNDAKKFIYSIRHMYGMEGGRKNYKSQSCSFICKNIPGTNYEGGCPFKNFDLNVLHTLLSITLPETKVSTFLQNTANLKPQETCKEFLKLTCKNVEDNLEISYPVQYYMKMIDPN